MCVEPIQTETPGCLYILQVNVMCIYFFIYPANAIDRVHFPSMIKVNVRIVRHVSDP